MGECLSIRGWRVNPSLPVFWQTHSYSELLDLAVEYKINYLTLHFGEELPIQTQRAHEKGIKIFIDAHELMPTHNEFVPRLPEEFIVNGKVNLDDPGFWDWKRKAYRESLSELPADGVILTFHETEYPIYEDGYVSSNVPKPERIYGIVNLINEECRRFGKTLIVRTFGYTPDHLRWLRDGFRMMPKESGIIVMSKHVPHDWQLFWPHNPLLGDVGHPQVAEFDLHGEDWGRARLPCCYPEYIKSELQHCIKKGVIGAFGRISNANTMALGTLNEVNIDAFSRLLVDPGLDTEVIWKGWVTRKFGEKAVGLVPILKRTFEVCKKLFYVKGCFHYWALNAHTGIGSLCTPVWRGYWWYEGDEQKRVAEIEESLLNPTNVVIDEAVREKEEAIMLSEMTLKELEDARPYLRVADYKKLRYVLAKERDCARVWRYLTESYLTYLSLPRVRVLTDFSGRGQMTKRDAVYQEKLQRIMRANENLLKSAGHMQRAYGEYAGDHWPASPTHIRAFVNQMNSMLSEPVVHR